ncbi:MAG: cytochrome c oxidase subunit II [Chloroflexi bacterium]|nr:cytochrome c oxidase subunit II [Chloroflexota bacterium]
MPTTRKAALWSLLGAALLMILLAGCNGDLPQSTVSPTTTNTRDMQFLYKIIFWVAAGVFVLVEGLLVYAVVRFRRKPNDPMPKQIHGNRTLEILWTVIPAVILVGVAVPTWQKVFSLAGPPPADALRVEVIGHQWWWEFRYPDQGFATANEMRVPAGRPISLEITSKDVIHSFQAPKLFQKMDVLPGKVRNVVFTPEQDGEYHGQCFELCGDGHADMRFRIFVLSAGDFDAWIAKHKTVPQVTDDLAKQGQRIFQTKVFQTQPGTPALYGSTPRWGCVACHTVGAAGAAIGPNLTYLGERTTLAGAIMPNTPENLAAWIRNPQQQKPGALMPRLGLSEYEVEAVVAFLESMK